MAFADVMSKAKEIFKKRGGAPGRKGGRSGVEGHRAGRGVGRREGEGGRRSPEGPRRPRQGRQVATPTRPPAAEAARERLGAGTSLYRVGWVSSGLESPAGRRDGHDWEDPRGSLSQGGA